MRKLKPSDAVFSKCGDYRYFLWRKWADAKKTCVFVGFNPSKADESYNDPTITRCISFAKQFGCGSVGVVNLFALCATYPEEVCAHESPIGRANNKWIKQAVEMADIVVPCWGNLGLYEGRDKDVLEMLRGKRLHALAVNKTGTPKHPLYVANGTRLVTLKGT